MPAPPLPGCPTFPKLTRLSVMPRLRASAKREKSEGRRAGGVSPLLARPRAALSPAAQQGAHAPRSPDHRAKKAGDPRLRLLRFVHGLLHLLARIAVVQRQVAIVDFQRQ